MIDKGTNNTKTTATNNNNPTNLNIMAAGATAGCVATVANHILLQSRSAVAVMPSMVTIMRAAPIHALIFLGYETMKVQAKC